MEFSSLQEFIHMNGHGVYVWSSMAITGIVLAGHYLLARHHYRKLLSQQ